MNLIRRLLIPAIFIILLVLLGIVAAIVHYVSPGLGTSSTAETTPSATPTPQVSDAPKGPGLAKFVGFHVLIDQGLSTDQLDSLQYSLNEYAKKTLGHQPATITLDSSTLKRISFDPQTNQHTSIAFKADLDSSLQQFKVELATLTGIRLYAVNPSSGSFTYDSGLVDLYNQ